MMTYLRTIVRLYGFKVTFKKLTYCGGYANLDGTFVVSPDCTKEKLISGVFHEMAHEVCAVRKKFPQYHRRYIHSSKSHALAIKRTAVRAEVFTDKLAAELMKFWFPKIKYIASYRTKKDREYLRDYWKAAIPPRKDKCG